MAPENKNTAQTEQKYPSRVVLNRWFYTEVVPRRLYGLHVSQDAQEKINFARYWLAREPELSYVIGQNHQAKDDPIFGGFVAKQIDPRVTRPVFAPVSYSHTTHTENPAESDLVKLNKLVQSCGVETIPVVQAYQAREPEKYNLTTGEIMKNYRRFVKRLNEIEESEKPYGCIIMPEGHRSPDGVLGKGEEGMADIVKVLRPALVIPVAISSPDHLEVNRKNFGKRIDLNIGDIMFVDQGDPKMNITEFMTHLAQALPLQMRGQYGK